MQPDQQSVMTTHQVFPGIQLIYCNVHTESAPHTAAKPASDHVFEIIHCREGRLEYDLNGEFCYLSSGDLAIVETNHVSPILYFPMSHFHGVMITIDLENTPECLSCLLEDVDVEPKELARKFFVNGSGFIARSNTSVEHIFSELYSIPDEIRQGYFKIKVLELLLFLSIFDIGRDEFGQRVYSGTQARFAKNIVQYLTEHMEERITLKQISEYFHISETYIKNIFKSVYGVSPYAFIREQKMESAAYMLEYTDKSVMEIASAHGYDNSSKFASAFRAVKNAAPNEYRNKNQKKL